MQTDIQTERDRQRQRALHEIVKKMDIETHRQTDRETERFKEIYEIFIIH